MTKIVSIRILVLLGGFIIIFSELFIIYMMIFYRFLADVSFQSLIQSIYFVFVRTGILFSLNYYILQSPFVIIGIIAGIQILIYGFEKPEQIEFRVNHFFRLGALGLAFSSWIGSGFVIIGGFLLQTEKEKKETAIIFDLHELVTHWRKIGTNFILSGGFIITFSIGEYVAVSLFLGEQINIIAFAVFISIGLIIILPGIVYLKLSPERIFNANLKEIQTKSKQTKKTIVYRNLPPHLQAQYQ